MKEKILKLKKIFLISIGVAIFFFAQYLYIIRSIDNTNPDRTNYSYILGQVIESKDGEVFVEASPNETDVFPMSEAIASRFTQYFKNENYSFENIFQIKLKPWYFRNNGNRFIDKKSEYLFVLKETDGKFFAESFYKTGSLFNKLGYCDRSVRGNLSDLDFTCFQPGFYTDLADNQLSFSKDEYFMQYCILLVGCDGDDKIDFTIAYFLNSMLHYILIIFSYLCIAIVYRIRKIDLITVRDYALQIILTIILWRILVLVQSQFEYNVWFIFRTIVHESVELVGRLFVPFMY